MIQLIAGCKAIHSEIFEDEDGVQDANSSFSLDKNLISSAHWKRKSLTNTRKQTARDLMEYTRSILGLNANMSFRAKNRFYKHRNWFGPSDLSLIIAMNDRDLMSFQLDRRFIWFVGYPSDGYDLIGNQIRSTAPMRSLKWTLAHVPDYLIAWTSCPRDRRRSINARTSQRSTTFHMAWNQIKQRDFSLTWRK